MPPTNPPVPPPLPVPPPSPATPAVIAQAQRTMDAIGRLVQQGPDTAQESSVLETLIPALDVTIPITQRQLAFREAMEVEILTHPSVLGSTRLFQLIKSTMEVLNMPVGEAQRRKRLYHRVFEALFDAEECERAVASAENISPARMGNEDSTSRNCRTTAANGDSSRSRSSTDSQYQLVKTMSTRFSRAEKFSGNVMNEGEMPFGAFRSAYIKTMEELDVPHGQRASLIHHALQGPALTYFYQAMTDITQLSEAFLAIEEKFLNESVKQSIRAKLLNTTLQQTRVAHSCSTLEALTHAERNIFSLSQQGPTAYRSDEAMIEVMERHVLKNEKWATLVATTRSTRPYSFQEYCAALQTYLRTIIDKGDFVDPPIAPAPALHVLYGEQYSAARQTASLNRPGTKSRKGNCRRCGKPGHWQAECRQKALQTHLDALHARVKEAGGSTGGTARVLFEIGEELDQITEDTQTQDMANSSSTEETERKESNAIFESFFAADIPPQDF